MAAKKAYEERKAIRTKKQKKYKKKNLRILRKVHSYLA